MIRPTKIRTFYPLAWLVVTLIFLVSSTPQSGMSQEKKQPDVDAPKEQTEKPKRIGHLVRVSLPITMEVSSNLIRTLKTLADKAPLAVRPEERPVVVLEFETSNGKTGSGSEREACQALARFLGDPVFNRVQTIAYVPSNRGLEGLEERNQAQLNGHAVLVAVAANQLAMEQGTAIGRAGVDERKIDVLVRTIYESVASQRLTLPVPLVQSMVDADMELYRVESRERGIIYVDGEKLKQLEASLDANETKTISKRGEMTLLSSQELADYGLIRLHPESRNELAQALNVPPESLEQSLADGKSWKAVRLELPNMIDSSASKWSVRSLRNQLAYSDFNLIILTMDEADGDMRSCLRLAQYLAELDPDKYKTVAFVKKSARGPAAILALGCDHLILSPDAKLGGTSLDPDRGYTPEEVKEFQPMLEALADAKQRDWSSMAGMLDPTMIVTRYRNRKTGQIRLLSNDEFATLDSKDDWAPLGPVGLGEGIDASTAERFSLARTIARNMDDIELFYQLEESPRKLQASQTDRFVEDIANFLSSPFVAPWLLFAGFFFFSTEMSAPGLSLPGFLATVCFMLFFWSQFLGGNADWVEVLLFLVGVVFVGIEIFILPGFGIFGIGGLLMIIIALVLASQSFIVPMNSAEVRQLPYSLMPVLGAGLGIVCGAFALRKILPNSPYFKRLMLEPINRNETGLDGSDPEAVVDWSHLNGQKGVTTTRLFPAGKARIGGKVYDVISKGLLIDKDQEIVVVEAKGNRVVVTLAEQ